MIANPEYLRGEGAAPTGHQGLVGAHHCHRVLGAPAQQLLLPAVFQAKSSIDRVAKRTFI